MGLPVGTPTIITGQNDGGKTATIAALRFLLTGTALADDDRTYLRPGSSGDNEACRVAATSVTGRFALNPDEQETLGLPGETFIRRVALDGPPQLQVRRMVPKAVDLRDLATLKVADLKSVAERYGLRNVGPANRLESWRGPLKELALTQEQVEDWVTASPLHARNLPRFVEFASTAEPNPEQEAGRALRAAFEAIMADDAMVGRIRELESEVLSRLSNEARALEEHIRDRCPDLASVSLTPRVSFNQGYQGVMLQASTTAGEDVGLPGAGAGRRRRINLAVWEWTTHLLDDFASDVVVAYDEPDTHLDYGHQRQLMDLIHGQCSKPRVQMLIATHSMNLIDGVDIADVVHLRLQDDRTVMERLVDATHEGIDAYLRDLTAALGLRNSVLLHESCFVGVEGPTETQSFPVLFRLTTGLPLQSSGIALIGCNGNEGALKVAQFLHNHRRRVAFVVDKDTTSNRSTRLLFREDKLRSYGFTSNQVHYVGGPRELEELFSDEQWAACANAHWPRDDGNNWDSSDIARLRDEGKFSEHLCETLKTGSSRGPLGKPDLTYTLSITLRTRDEVPEQLRLVFQSLVALARGD